MAFADRPVAHLLGANGPIHAVSYSASPGTYILAGSADRSIRLYNPQPSGTIHPPNSYLTKRNDKDKPAVPEGRLIQTYAAHGYEVLSLTVAGDNARFASAGGDRAVFLWDVATATTLRRFSNGGHSSRVNCVAFAGEGDSLLVSGGFDTTVRIWDTRGGGGGGGKPIQTLDDARDGISAIAVRGAELVAGSVDGRVRTYDARMGRVVTDMIGASVTSLSLTRDGKALLVGSLDSRVRLMDRENGACLKTYEAEGKWGNEELRVQSVLGAKEKYVVAGDEMTAAAGQTAGDDSGRLWVWDLVSGDQVATLKVLWGPNGGDSRKKVIGRDGKEKERRNVVSCVTWRENGWGDQFCAGGTSGVVSVFGFGG